MRLQRWSQKSIKIDVGENYQKGKWHNDKAFQVVLFCVFCYTYKCHRYLKFCAAQFVRQIWLTLTSSGYWCNHAISILVNKSPVPVNVASSLATSKRMYSFGPTIIHKIQLIIYFIFIYTWPFALRISINSCVLHKSIHTTTKTQKAQVLHVSFKMKASKSKTDSRSLCEAITSSWSFPPMSVLVNTTIFGPFAWSVSIAYTDTWKHIFVLSTSAPKST